MSLVLYRALAGLADPFIEPLLARRQRRGKEDAARLGERLGRASRARPDGPLVWLHGASVGESLSVLPLIERLLARPDPPAVLVTTGTVTSATLLSRRLPAGAIHQYVPVDRLRAVRRFLDHWRPDLALWIESELWPNLVCETADRGVPMALVQGRMSERAFRRWRRFAGLARRLLGGFSLCLAQDEATAVRLRGLGARDVRIAGNLKEAAPPLPADDGELARLRAALGDRPVWLAASTHPGEETAIARILPRLAEAAPGLLTIVAPRHPARGAEIARLFADADRTVGRRSDGATPVGCDVYVADTIGELGLFYRLAPVVFVGGSLVAHGGHNPMEAARLGCAVLFGPHMANFVDMVAALTDAEAAGVVTDGDELADTVAALLGDAPRRERMAARAGRVAAAGSRIVDDVMAALGPLLPPRRPAGPDAS